MVSKFFALMYKSVWTKAMSRPSGHEGRTCSNIKSNKVFKSFEVEKLKLDRKIFSSWKIKKESWCAGFERWIYLVTLSNLIHYTTRLCITECMEYFCFYHKKNF